MKIFLTGATGVIGRRLVLDRLERGDRLVVLSRDGQRATRLFAADVNPNIEVVEGDVTRPGEWQSKISGCDAVIHLAGAGVADRRWNTAYRRVLVESRVESTRQIVAAMESASSRPRVLVNASAIGFYGECGAEVITESTGAGQGFLAHLCTVWEDVAQTAESLGVRVVRARIGIVLDEKGSVPRRMIKPFRWYIGGTIGRGKQYWSWIHIRDVLGIMDLALRDSRAHGAMNITAPNPVTHEEFCRTIGELLNRPCWIPVPPSIVRALLGPFASTLRTSARVVPAVAESLGYVFFYPELKPALAATIPGVRKQDDSPSPIRQLTVSIDPAPPPVDVRIVESNVRPTKRIRLLAFDVDGTLLKSDGRVGQGAIDALRAAQRAGCVVLPASARPPRTTRALVQAIGIAGPTINYNGAVIWHPQEERALYHQPIDADLAREVIVAARAVVPECIVSVEILDRWYTDRIDPARPLISEPDYVGSFEHILKQPVTKIDIHTNREALAHIVGVLRTEFWSTKRVAMFFSEIGLVQIVHPLVDKGIALQRIAGRMKLERDEVMAIGDGPNDTGMIEWAGFGVAMGNADPLLRTLAKASVPSNNDDGLARAIHRYVLQS